jgi:Zn-dependent protease
MDLTTALALLPGLVIGITVHECAHAWSAALLGDGFPRRQGRVSLNPLRHLSPLGTLALFVLPFGWGRPVVVNLYNFKHPKRDYFLSSLAGPLANVLVIGVCLVVMQATRQTFAWGRAAEPALLWGHRFLTYVALINAVLAFVNLIPIPPLDGSKVWPWLIRGVSPTFGRAAQRLFLILLLVLVFTNSLSPVMSRVLGAVLRVLPDSDAATLHRRLDAGAAAYQRGDYAEAERQFTAALAVHPRHSAAHYDRAAARGAQKKWTDALDDLNRAVALDGSVEHYYTYRADVLDALGRSAEAEADRARVEPRGGVLRLTTRPTSRPA